MHTDAMEAARVRWTGNRAEKPLTDQVGPRSPNSGGVIFLVKGVSRSVVDIRTVYEDCHTERLQVRHDDAGGVLAMRCASRRARKVKCAVCWSSGSGLVDASSSSAARKPTVDNSRSPVKKIP